MQVEHAAVEGLAALPAEVLEHAHERRGADLAAGEAVEHTLAALGGLDVEHRAAELRERRDDLVVGQLLAPRRALVLGQLQRMHDADLAR